MSTITEDVAVKTVATAPLDEYMAKYGPQMAARVSQMYSPLYDPVRDGETPGMRVLSECRVRPYPPQAACIEAIVRTLKQQRAAWCVGEMGTGKTVLAMGTHMVMRSQRPAHGWMRTAITCPPQLVKKWAAHAEKMLPGARVHIVHSFMELNALRSKPTSDEIWIFSRDRTKLSYAWRLGLATRRQHVGTHDDGTMMSCERLVCPRCGQTVKVKDHRDKEHDATIDDFVKGDKLRTRRSCGGKVLDARGVSRFCGEQLWQASNGSPDANGFPMPKVSPRRMAPSEFIQRFLGVCFDLYVCDEAHELKGGNSLQGSMGGVFVNASKNTLYLTGTLTGGYAENLEALIWRSAPRGLADEGIEHSAAGHREFVMRYGVLETTTTFSAESQWTSADDLILGKGKKSSCYEKSRPGISPILFSRHLLQSAVFLRLKQMHENLPPFSEHIHVVGMTPEQEAGLRWTHHAYKEHLKDMKSRGEPSKINSAARHLLMRWSDRPFTAEKIIERTKDGSTLLACSSIALPENQVLPKEKKLVEIVMEARRRGRKSWVYTEMTGDKWDVGPRLVKILEKQGLRVGILRSQGNGGPKPEDREAWIAKNSPKVDVVISNPNLVKTGLDLYDFPTLIFYFIGDNTYTLRQAARRAWRLGQNESCETHYMVYGALEAGAKALTAVPTLTVDPSKHLSESSEIGLYAMLPSPYTSIQSAAMSLMAKKMASSVALEGDFSSEGLAAMAGDGSVDVQTALAQVIAGTLQVESPDVAFARYRAQMDAAMPSLARAKTGPITIAAPVASPVKSPAAPIPPIARTQTAASPTRQPTIEHQGVMFGEQP